MVAYRHNGTSSMYRNAAATLSWCVRSCSSKRLKPGAGLPVLTEGTAAVIDALARAGLLLHEERYAHKYPYDWRTKQPTIFRATDQVRSRGCSRVARLATTQAGPDCCVGRAAVVHKRGGLQGGGGGGGGGRGLGARVGRQAHTGHAAGPLRLVHQPPARLGPPNPSAVLHGHWCGPSAGTQWHCSHAADITLP